MRGVDVYGLQAGCQAPSRSVLTVSGNSGIQSNTASRKSKQARAMAVLRRNGRRCWQACAGHLRRSDGTNSRRKHSIA